MISIAKEIKSNEWIIYSFVIMVTLKQLDTGRNNNFNLLRFIAATFVVFSHSFLLTGTYSAGPYALVIQKLDLGGFGVDTFFAISGFLITKSMFRQPTLNGFVWARFLRIFPGLFGTAVFCAFVIGPVCTTLPLKDYFSNKTVYAFIYQLTTLHNYSNYLPATFEQNPYPGSMNSPMWTLPTELLMYLGVLLCGVLLLIWKRYFKALIMTLPVLVIVGLYFKGMHYSADYMIFAHSFATIFLLGAVCYLLSSKMMLSLPILLGLFVVWLILSNFNIPVFFYPRLVVYAFYVLLVYSILFFAYHPKLQVKSFHKLGDYSYGLYIYAFPIQQLMVSKAGLLNPFAHFICTFPLALVVAVLSWHFIEKPMLSLKTLSFFTKTNKV